MFAIEIQDVCIKYGARYILRDFSLSVNEGEKVLLNGSSGCGKSTVLKAISGLVVPCRGSISIYGQTLNGHDIWHLRRLMAYVQQEPELGTGSVKNILEQPFSYKANQSLKKTWNGCRNLCECLISTQNSWTKTLPPCQEEKNSV
ncbi:MAG: ATP-binding cassette domain-containing protein [Victivallales bacterium]|nr:ATP-binding cassette domain-containing protein [Victivallales bacterium]